MRVIILSFLILVSIISYSQEKRLALVIGNGIYEYGGTLLNPENDAKAMANALKSLEFDVIEYENIDMIPMKKAIDNFGMKLINYDVGLFFYAGHGVQVKGYNYLIPADAKIYSENDVEFSCVEVGRVLAKMEDAKNKMNIVILDACRDNPFERSWTRSAKGRGLAYMSAPVGSIIAYATAPGSTASDGTGDNGLYTSALLKNMIEPGIKIEDVFKKVRIMVKEQSNEAQIPWESTSLEGDFYFNFSNQDLKNKIERNEEYPLTKINSKTSFAYKAGSFTDTRDGEIYRWVNIGEQIWMARNLNYTVTFNSFCYNNQKFNCDKYGRLYNWEIAKNICPAGWHLPTDDDWIRLELFLDMSWSQASSVGYRGNNEGEKLKEEGTFHWLSNKLKASNSSGFTALPGGNYDGINFYGLGNWAIFWSSTESDSKNAWCRILDSNYSQVGRENAPKNNAFSVRCIKD
jgi:uncharacterized protein (TIGR02145 family)